MVQIKQIGDCISNGYYSRHSTFNKVSNFINADRKLLTVAESEEYLSPNTLIIDGKEHKYIQTLEVSSEKIKIDGKESLRSNLSVYHSSISLNRRVSSQIPAAIETYIQKNSLRLNLQSLAFLINPDFEEKINTGFHKALIQHIKIGWQKLSTGEVKEGTERIKGSGHGLTPSGDDFIAGLLYAMILLEIFNNIKNPTLKKTIFENATGKNIISETMLYNAYSGNFFKALKDFILAFRDNENPDDTFKKMILTGETSGSDLLTGLILGLKHFKSI